MSSLNYSVKIICFILVSVFVSACHINGDAHSNQPPVAQNSSFEVQEDQELAIRLQASDPDSDSLVYTFVTQPQNGTLSGDAPDLMYTPNENYNGEDSVVFMVSDGSLSSSEATVSISVTSINDAPTVESQNIDVGRNSQLTISFSAADADSESLQYQIVDDPQNGVLSGSFPNMVYTPASNYTGSDSFTFLANDGEIDSNIATVSITVAISDKDGNGIPDDVDAFPDNSSESIDSDGDGIGNNADTDDDNDSVLDTDDAFPLDATESVDTDNDGTGNNADTDDDGDSVLDADDAFPLDGTESVDTDNDGTGNNADTDDDGDSVLDADDAFPLDVSESIDTDSDGTGNNADTDDDGDSVLDADDAFPLDANESVDTDNDGTGNNADTDDDNDSVLDADDAFPLDATESVDTDNDGTGNNADTDDDGDSVLDADDAFPLDGTESVDTDNDGTGNNADTDDDNDSVLDADDAFPLDATESVDTDGDGTGNNADTDDDNDSVLDTDDAFPLDANESVDTDNDGTGNNADTDDDNDSVLDADDAFPLDANESIDTDSDGTGNNADTDDDNDSVLDADDAFPLDANESVDTDADGTGNNADTDDDNDSVLDADDAFPLDATESVDTDNDGTGNNADTDDDGDSVLDADDAFPLDATESVDTDGDGTGNNADTDDDNDSVLDADDAFPLDATESVDTDNDGTGNNADTDDDNDSVLDADDAFPLDATESVDTDNDGTGNNADTDDDNDSVLDADDAFPLDATESSDLDGDGIGDNSDPDRDGDGVSNEDDYFPDDKDSSTVPTVKILTPGTLITVGSSPITVSGTIDDSTARLTVNGVDVAHTGGQFEVDVALEEGLNSIVARGIDAKNHEGLATISVSLDKTPPHVTVQSPESGQTVYTDKISVGGLVNDIVRGAVTENDAVVRVNGQLAAVTNRSYLAEDVQLVEGENTIEVIASDAVGNVGSKVITITYEIQTKNIIELVSGQSQAGVIVSALNDPLIVKLTTDGAPVVDKTVIFRVTEGDGLLQVGTTSEANGAIAKTDENGEASVSFAVGSRAGEGNHRVRARAVGFDGEVVFYASAIYGEGNKAGVIAGANQRGSIRQPLPQPFVIAVTDEGANLIPDADIEFKVLVGSGKFQNDETTYLTKTDKDGRASAHFTLGSEEGLDKQRVIATLVGTNATAGFTASGFMPGDPGQTSIVGVVLDNQDNPIPAVTIRVDGTTRQAVTDAQGQFKITEVPVGPVHLLVEGSTTTRAGEWPTLSYNIVTVPGVENPMSSPIYLVELDMETATTVGLEDTELTLPEVPGFKLKVKAGSVTFPDGSKSGKLSVTVVNANKIPMAPPNGMQPQFIVTIQPHGAKFDPPAELTLPNVDGHLPGAEVEMYSYDHDLEEFVTIGLGTTSKDGSIVTSNKGVGVIKAGWHCGSQAGGSGCCEGGGGGAPDCGECQDLTSSGSCPVNYSCKAKSNPDSVVISAQVKGNCKTETCGRPQPNPGDVPPEECGICEGDTPRIDKDEPLDDQKPDDCKELLCEGSNPKDETAAVQAKGGDFECKLCDDGEVEDGPDSAPCDDGLFCTSEDGENPGPDGCNGGKCQGKNIEDKEYVGVGGGTGSSEILELLRGIEGASWVPNIKGSFEFKGIKQCCESQKKILEGTKTSGTISAELSIPEQTTPPYPLGPIQIRGFFSAKASGSFTASGTDINCDGLCTQKYVGSVAGTLEGGVEAAVLHPELTSLKGQVSGGGSYSWAKVCNSAWKSEGCFGPPTIAAKATFLGLIDAEVNYTVESWESCL